MVALVLAAWLLFGCHTTMVPAGRIAVSGAVRDRTVSVRAPYLQQPNLDPRVSLPATFARPPEPADVRTRNPDQPTVSGLVVAALTTPGTNVRAGQIVARLDDRALAIGVQVAAATSRRSHAEVDVLDARLSELESKADDIARTRAGVLAAITKARAGRSTLKKNIARLEAIIASLPRGRIPTTSSPPPPGPDPRILLARLKAQLAKLEAGLAQASTGLAKIGRGASALADARTALRGGRAVLREAAKAADAGVPVARARRAQAIIVAPYDGVVTWATEQGTTLMANAPVVELRRSEPAIVDAYLTAEEARRAGLGDRAAVSADWLDGRTLAASVTQVRQVFEYPPTSMPTTEIHMTRAFRVTVTLDDSSAAIPPGTPVDLTILTR